MSAYFAALSVVIGGGLAYLLVVRPVLRDDVADVVRARCARFLAWCGPVLIVAAYLQLAARVARTVSGVSFGQALAPWRIWSFLTAPAEPGAWVSTGVLVLIQNALLLLAALALLSLFARQRLTAISASAVALATAASLVLSVPGKLAGLTVDKQLDTWLTQAHIVAAAAWLGGLVCLAALARSRPFGADASLYWAPVWSRFSVLALVAVGVLVASGSWLAWRHVGSVDQLVSTSYGRFLLLKLLLVAALVGTGAYNQLVLLPRIARAHASGDLGRGFSLALRHFPAVVRGEAALGLSVLVIVPFLTGSARAQAGQPKSPPIDGGLLVLAAVLVAALGASLYATYRVALLRARQASAQPAAA